jgi:DNA-binding MarR family transcriptional regulator
LELLFATASLFVVTIVASFIYYRRIKQAQSEYEVSKDIVRSVTLGFTQQLAKLSGAIKGIKQDVLDAKLEATEARKTSHEAFDAVRDGKENTLSLTKRMDEADKAFAAMREEIKKLAKIQVGASLQKDMEAPIPLKQGAVLDQLTQTELEVITLIEEVGEGSVPEIRKRIEKTREHTARLLKKLYEKGFIDRNTSRMPYRYYVRKEIKELIKQQRKNMRIAF